MSDTTLGEQVSAPQSSRVRALAPGGLLVLGGAAAVVAIVADSSAAASAASQVWSPFVLVGGLLIVGLAADQDGLFAAAGRRLARLAPNGLALFAGAAVAVAVVTALLNLDTSVVFLTPVLAYAARSRGRGEEALLVGCLLLSNAGSLLLPGSNLTNLIVLGHLHLSGRQFLGRMALPWLASVIVTGVVIAIAERRSLLSRPAGPSGGADAAADARAAGGTDGAPDLTLGLGVVAVAAVTVLVLVLRSPAVPVAGVGVVVAGLRLSSGRMDQVEVRRVVGLPVLVGLFGIALALGTLGRTWSGPAVLLSHLDAVGTAAVAALSTIVVNNLPAAALLAARVPPHPYALLVGLDIGPNLFVTGSLAWILWMRTARSTGSRPPVARTVGIGLVSVPVALAAALAMLAVTGAS